MKTISLCILFVLSISSYSIAQDITKPQFIGGDKALVDFLQKNMVYPAEAIKQKQEGKTLVAFTVNEDGSIANVHIIKSSWHLLDVEAIRIVKLMPKWIPAFDNGVNKKEMIVLPVTFDLSAKGMFYN